MYRLPYITHSSLYFSKTGSNTDNQIIHLTLTAVASIPALRHEYALAPWLDDQQWIWETCWKRGTASLLEVERQARGGLGGFPKAYYSATERRHAKLPWASPGCGDGRSTGKRGTNTHVLPFFFTIHSDLISDFKEIRRRIRSSKYRGPLRKR